MTPASVSEQLLIQYTSNFPKKQREISKNTNASQVKLGMHTVVI
jgi:hypothetical protein